MQRLLRTYFVPGSMLYIIHVNYQNIPVKKVAQLAPVTDAESEAQILRVHS